MDLHLEPAPLGACGAADRFLQSDLWAAFKAEFGWRPLAFTWRHASGATGTLLVMTRGLAGPFSFAYCPHGPDFGPLAEGLEADPSRAASLLADVAAQVAPHLGGRSLFLRFDPPWALTEVPDASSLAEVDGAGAESSEGAGVEAAAPRKTVERPGLAGPFRKAQADVQPPDTVLLDLSLGEEALLAGMKPKWRYNIKLAAKKGVVVSSVSAGQGEAAWGPCLEDFYVLYEETSARDHIALHPKAYYRRLFELAEARGGHRAFPGHPPTDLRVWQARHGETLLASVITVFRGSEAIYLYGASANEGRNLMPSYALQWEAIRAAAAAGCTYYDFFGISPTGDDPSHPMAGLYRFKTGFGGRVVHRGGSWDYPLRRPVYGAFRAAEALRAWYFKDFRKRGLSRS